MITFNNTGISSTPTKSGRSLVYTDIIYNGETYKWAIYVPPLNNMSLGEYMEINADIYEQDIAQKEALWSSMSHTKEVENEYGVMVTVYINKSEVVCPTIPDYIESVSDFSNDIASIKRLLQTLTNFVMSGNTLTEKQINDLTVINDYYDVRKEYKVNDLIDYNGKLYKVLQNHTSQVDWIPSSTPALYLLKQAEGVIAEWIQPTGAHDAYSIDDKVLHNSFTWKSLINSNVWEPGGVGTESLWTKI